MKTRSLLYYEINIFVVLFQERCQEAKGGVERPEGDVQLLGHIWDRQYYQCTDGKFVFFFAKADSLDKATISIM